MNEQEKCATSRGSGCEEKGDADERAGVLLEQLRLLEVKRGEAEELRRRGERPGEGFANDLAGIRLVILAALLAGRVPEHERADLERSEREARRLLEEAIVVWEPW